MRMTRTSGTPMPSAAQRYRSHSGSCGRDAALLRFGGGSTGAFAGARGGACPLVGAASLRALLNISWKRFRPAPGAFAAGGATMIVGADAKVAVSSPAGPLTAVPPNGAPPTDVSPTDVLPADVLPTDVL